jgi:predicted RNA-binding Zn-ribbon protein involved in translation (DUF1610 family)
MKWGRKTKALVAENDRLTALVTEDDQALCPNCGTGIGLSSRVASTSDFYRVCWECGLTMWFAASVAS